MTAQRVEVMDESVMSDLEPELLGQVVRRAGRLCGIAEPHTTEVPCAAHLQEAHRQLLEIPA